MRANRPEGFTAHSGITNWQLPYGMNLEGILRAGSAPNQEEKTPKRSSAQAIQRNRQPVRAIAIKNKTRGLYKKPEVKGVKLGEIEDAFEDFDIEDRPPCRQNSNLFDLEDTFNPKMNGFIKEQGRGIRADHRPPSRHKTPPKALGLELPPKSIGDSFPIDQMFQDSPISSLENESLSNTMPLNLTETEKIRKKLNKLMKEEDPESKIRLKPRSAKNKQSDKIAIRMWSAGKTNKKIADVPIILNKREKGKLSFSSSRKEKREEEKKEVVNEDRRINAYKKTTEKRAFSSQNKQKNGMIVPFQTNLEPEFLNLFAKSEDFNF